MTLGSASFEFLGNNRDLLIKGAQAEQATKKSYEAIAKAAGTSAADVERAHNKMIAAQNRSAQSVKLSAAEWIKGAAAVAGFVGVAQTANQIIVGIARSTMEAQKAQFALSKAYGSSAPAMAAFAKQFGDEIGRSTTEVSQAAVTMATLTRSYGLSGEQAKQLIRITADLAAANGEDLAQSAKDIQAAIRGEAEAAEKLGVVLSESRVATSQLGADGEKLWQTLTEEEKATLRLLEVQKQLSDRTGAAAEQADGAAGAFNRLNASLDELGAAIGSTVMEPIAAVANFLATMAENATIAIEVLKELAATDVSKLLQIAGALLPFTSTNGAAIAGFAAEVDARRRAQEQQRKVEGEAKRAAEKAAADAETARKAEEIKAIAQERLDLERRKKAADERVEIEKDRIDAEREANQEAYDAERTRLEVQRDARVKASQAAEKAAIKSIEAEAEASEKAFEARIQRAEQERDAEIDAAEAAKDAALAAIKERQQALEATREQEDRARDDERRAEDQALEDQRAREDAEVDAAKERIDQIRDLEDRGIADRRQAEQQARDARRQADDQEREDRRAAEDAEVAARRQREDRELEARARAVEQRREQEDRQRQDARAQQDRDIADRREREDRDAEAAHDANLTRIQVEHEQRLAAIDAEIEGIRRRADEEDARLQETADLLRQQFEDEQRAAEDAYERSIRALDIREDIARRAHDDAIRRIKDEERAEDNRHRSVMQGLDDEKDARLAAVDAQIDALDKLDEADRRAEEDRRNQDRLSEGGRDLERAISTGNLSEIEKAQHALDEIRREISQTNVKRERDAARDVLKARKDAISQEIEDRKRAEDEKHQAIQAGLAQQQQAADAALAHALGIITAEREALKTRYDEEREAAKLALEQRLAEIEQRREALATETAEAIAVLQARREQEEADYDAAVERINGEFALAQEKRALQRENEDRALEDRRLKEDHDRQDRRAAEDVQLEEQRRRLSDRRADEDRERGERRTKEDRERQEYRTAEDQRLSLQRTAEDRARSDRRTAEDAQFNEGVERRNRQRLDEDRVINERRLAEDRFRKDERTAQDLALSAQLAAVQVTLDEEKRRIDAHYNGVGGVLPTLRQAMSDAKDAYQERLRVAREQFAAERDEINAVYTNVHGTGLLDRLEEAKKKTDDSLKDQVKYWERWRKDVIKEIEEAEKRLKEFQQQQSIGPIHGPAIPGSGLPPGVGPGNSVSNPPEAQVESIIRGAFSAVGIPAEDAIAVWSGEGRSAYVGDQGSSFGPYQLHMGGLAPQGSGNEGAGLGDQFRQDTGLDPRDPSTVAAQIQWVANYVRRNGWNGQWHGAPSHLKHKRYAAGHLFDEPTWTIGRSGQVGMIGETGHPERLLGVRDTARFDKMTMPSLMAGAPGRSYSFAGEAARSGGGIGAAGGREDRIVLDIMAGPEFQERFVFEGISLNVRRGNLVEVRKQ